MMQLPLIAPESTWKPPRISELPEWNRAKRIAIDVETCDPELRKLGPGVRRGAYITGISFALEDANRGYYLPLRHKGGDNMEDLQQTIGWVRQQAKTFTGEVVGANLGYDLDFLLEEGIDFSVAKKLRDVQIAEALIDELQMSYSLETICRKYLGMGKNEAMLREAAIAYGIDPKSQMYLLPARFVGEYACADATLPLLALRRQEREIESQDLWKIYNMESDLLPVLTRMRRRGVRVNLDRLDQVEQWSMQQERSSLAEVEKLTGVRIPFNSVWQAAALVPALQAIGCKIPVTAKTKKPSIDKAFLASIDHPVAHAVARARRVNKLRTTFVQSIRNHIIGDRIHATYHQLRSSDDDDDVESGEGAGARYGRCSSQNPNFQQQPIRDPESGVMWRSIYIPEEGEEWCSADFSSQEPRQAVHYATTTKLGNVKVRTPNGYVWVNADESARAMADKYRNDLSTDPHQALADIIMGRRATKEERSNAKIIFLGLSYGMGGAKLCRSLGYSTIMAVHDPATRGTVDASTPEGKALAAQGQRIFEAAGKEGQDLLDKFDASVPFVRALNKVCQNAANKFGYIRTQAGRKCRFPRDEMGNVQFTHKALNRLIQGSAADQTKIAMIELDRQGFFMVAQIHDECAFSIKDRNEAKQIGEIMENIYKLSVPTRCDVEIGASWGEAK
jgi:DNA polymerase I-like protein with 3'-5' exonuclease and polymerase domains